MEDILPHLNWSAINTALLLGALGYLWKQSRTVDQIRQALFGVNGKGGAIDDITALERRMEVLNTTLTTLNVTVTLLNNALIDKRWDGSERRTGK